MKSTTIASESTNLFYVKLRTSPTPDWYIQDFDQEQRKLNKVHLDKILRKEEFLIDHVGFYRKHVWFHFKKESLTGWLPLKSIRDNYRRLKVPVIKSEQNNYKSNGFAAIKMALMYQKYDSNVDNILHSLIDSNNNQLTPQLFLNVVLSDVGSFRNVSNKSLRRVRNQLRRQRPVVVWGSAQLPVDSDFIVLIGFNKRRLYYNDPASGQQRSMSKKQFMKYWRTGNYQAFSY